MKVMCEVQSFKAEADSLNIGEKVAEKSPVWKAGIAPICFLSNGWKVTYHHWWKQLLMRSGICRRLTCAVHGALCKGGLADISEYKCLSLAQMEAMGRKGDFSA